MIKFLFSNDFIVGRSNSPSEDSAGTGDELQPGTRVKRRSIKKKMSSGGSGTHLSDSDLHSSLHGNGFLFNFLCVFLHIDVDSI
jgi:hypothetical protein